MGMVKLNSIPSLESVLYLGYKLDTKLFLDICITLATWQEPTNTKKIMKWIFSAIFSKIFLSNQIALNGNLFMLFHRMGMQLL